MLRFFLRGGPLEIPCGGKKMNHTRAREGDGALRNAAINWVLKFLATVKVMMKKRCALKLN